MSWYPKKIDITASAELSEAELLMLDGVTAGTTAAGKVVTTAAVTNKVAALDITDLKVGGTSVTSTAAQLNRAAVTTAGVAEASKVAVLGATKNIDTLDVAALKIGGVAVASTAAQLDAAVAGTPLIYRTNVLTADVNAGATAVVPAVAGKRFHVESIMMRSNGNVGTATTVGVKEDGGAVFLSHVTADLTNGVWHDLVTGTPVITGITSGGTTAVANKALLAYCAGGVMDTATSIDYIVCGYYTTA